MRTIHKYPLIPGQVNKVKMPMASDIISAGYAQGQVCIWAEVETKDEMSERAIGVFGTGQEIKEDFAMEKIGTVVQPIKQDGAEGLSRDLVWHVFEIL